MKTIGRAYMKCKKCQWKGILSECGNVEHDDGSLDCPQCHNEGEMDWEREKLEIIQGIAYTLSRSVDIPSEFVQLVDEHFWELV